MLNLMKILLFWELCVWYVPEYDRELISARYACLIFAVLL